MVSNLKEAPLDGQAQRILAAALNNLEPHWREALKRRRALWRPNTRRDGLIGLDEHLDLKPLEIFLSSTDADVSDSEEVFLDKVRQEDYSAADLFVELLAAQEALPAAISDASNGNSADASAAMAWSEARMQDLFLRILEETSCVYESMAESGKRGYCQVDPDGHIVFANRGLKQICGIRDLRGVHLATLLGEGADAILEQIGITEQNMAHTLQLTIRVAGENPIPVLVEFAPIPEGRGTSGAYVAITDLSEVRRPYKEAQRQILERARFGVIQTDRERNLLYANKAALEMLGVDSVEGRTIEDLPVSREQRQELLQRFQQRMEGESDVYEVTIRRKVDGREIPVSVVAIPELGEHNEIVGAFAIMRSRELDNAARVMHKSIETAKSVKELLEMIAEQIETLMDYDYMSMYVFSKDGVFSRPIFTKKTTEGESRFVTRWYKSNESTREWLRHNEEWIVEDIEQFLIQMGDTEMLQHPDVQRILEEGVRYWYNQPIVLRNRQVAGISLGTREPASLKRAADIMNGLPLAEAARMVFQLFESQEQKFLINIIRALHASDTAEQAASILTKELASQFDWDNVSIFRLDDSKKQLVLLQQGRGSGPMAFEHESTLRIPLANTVSAKACEIGGAYYINDVRACEDIELASIGEDTQSVLCYPVMVGGGVPWILRVEDCQNMAFVQEDIDSLERILREVSSILSDLSEHYRLRHVFEHASDAIITCKNDGEILDVNGPAVLLFEMSKGELEGQNLKDLFAVPKIVETILARPRAREVVLAKSRGGEGWRALVTGFRISELDRNVLIVQDLALYEQIAELKKNRSLFSELAHQTRAPISLMQGALRRLSKDTDTAKLEDFVQKMTAYVRKLELTHRQIFDRGDEEPSSSVQPLLIRVDQMLVDRILDILPITERESIDVHIPDDLPLLSVDVYRTDFIFSTIIGHYLRFAPINERVHLKAEKVGRSVEVTVSATLPDDIPVHSQDADAKGFAARFTLENPMVRRYVEDMGGTFEAPSPPGNMVCAVRLPCENAPE